MLPAQAATCRFALQGTYEVDEGGEVGVSGRSDLAIEQVGGDHLTVRSTTESAGSDSSITHASHGVPPLM